MYTAEDLAPLMATYVLNPDIQLRQTRFRMGLVECWRIPTGARVLEIGCGQGDMTAVLANAVGNDGHVTAVDIVDTTYGAPITVGASTQHLMAGPLGKRIEFRFHCDVLDIATEFESDSFDYVVLAHCSWYVESLDRLREILRRARSWAPRLCLSEWDLEPRSVDQLGHLLAVLIQGQVESFKTHSQSNVRTPHSHEILRDILEKVGWNLGAEVLIDETELEDANWEISACLEGSLREATELKLPSKFQAFLTSQIAVLQRLADRGNVRPLPSYSIMAERTAIADHALDDS